MSAGRSEPRRRGVVWWALFGLRVLGLAVQTVRMRIADSAVRERNGELAALLSPKRAPGAVLAVHRASVMIDVRGLGTEAAEAQFDNFMPQRMDGNPSSRPSL